MKIDNSNAIELTLFRDGIVDVLLSEELENSVVENSDQISFVKTDNGIYGTLSSPFVLDENGNIDGKQMESVTISLYQKLFTFANKHSNYTLARIWNFVPFIVRDLDGSAPDIEVYRCFNSGRYKAFHEQFGPEMESWRIPAATGVGAPNQVLRIEFYATKAQCLFFENKVQIPAYLYSQKYGKLPPVFARGTVCEFEDKSFLLAAGTASVVNEDTLYVGDICGQIGQTFDNLESLTSITNLEQYGLDYEFTNDNLEFLRIYYKKASDLDLIMAEIPKYVLPDCEISYVNTDICRKDLVIEMEGVYTKKIV